MGTPDFSSYFSGGRFEPPAPKPRANPSQNLNWLRSAAILPKVIKNPIESFSANAYELPVHQTRLFQMPVTMAHDPELIRHIFVENADLLEAHPVRQNMLKPVLREGMLTAEGELWRRARRAISPIFIPRNVHGFAKSMREVTEQTIQKWKQGPDKVSLADELARLTYKVLSRSLFSGDVDDISDQMIADVGIFLKYLSRPDPIDFLGAPNWMPRPTKLRGHGAFNIGGKLN